MDSKNIYVPFEIFHSMCLSIDYLVYLFDFDSEDLQLKTYILMKINEMIGVSL